MTLPNRPDYDGRLTLIEANEWYRHGNGDPLYVDGNKIDLTPLYIEDLKIGKTVSVNFAHPNNANFNTGLVYGNINLTLLDKSGHVRIGNENGLFDIYDFVQKIGGNSFRNIATKIGNIIAGEGNPYEIRGYNNAQLKHRPKVILNW